MNISLIVTIAVIVFLLIFVAIGFHRGFLRVLLSVASLALTLVLAGAFAPKVAQWAENSTQIGTSLSGKIEDYVNSKLGTVTGNVEEAQESFINSLPLTADMKNELRSGTNVAGQIQQGTQTFARNIAKSLSSLIIRILSYVLLFIVILLVLRLIMRLSNLINHIPILGGINRFFGAILGLAEGAVFLWILCLVVMMLSGTPEGIACENVIQGSKFLTFIYEKNYLMDIVNTVVGLFTV